MKSGMILLGNISGNELVFHLIYEHKDQAKWSCIGCSFQTKGKAILKNHLNFKDKQYSSKHEVKCGQCFSTYWYLTNYHEMIMVRLMNVFSTNQKDANL